MSTEHKLEAGRSDPQAVTSFVVLLALALALGLRLIHMTHILPSPLTFQRGPDEDYYLRFGQAVAGGSGDSPEFAFMDPAYGFILGLVFKLLGTNIWAVYLIQIFVDTVTAYGIFLIGRELGRPRAGLAGALVYGLTCTAVYFSTTLLKATWVANFMTLWVLGSLVLLRSASLPPWLLFGLLCGYGIALRANLALMAGLSALLLTWLSLTWSRRSLPQTALRVGVFAMGLALPLALLALRNEHVSGTYSPIPNNGGIVLHQLYNPENPTAALSFPTFVRYATPSQIWLDYSREAERRVGRALTPHEIDRYWRAEAVAYIGSHPAGFLRNALTKLSEFVAYVEVPNNRSLLQDRLFSPVLKALPSPFGWLLALGLPGIAILLNRDRRAVLVIAPIAAAAATVAVFFSEDRFRFHAVPMLAFGAGLLLEDLYAWIKTRETGKCLTSIAACVLLGGVSLFAASHMPQPQLHMDRVIWGYLKMNSRDAMVPAKQLAMQAVVEQPTNPKIQEALAYIAAAEGRYPDAVALYRRTAELRPDDHVARYNLAKMLVKIGDNEQARKQAAVAASMEPLPEYLELLEELSVKGAADR
jgi:tetratricopeptide (TPR) repeat protein